jgi:hypothetical protein
MKPLIAFNLWQWIEEQGTSAHPARQDRERSRNAVCRAAG